MTTHIITIDITHKPSYAKSGKILINYIPFTSITSHHDCIGNYMLVILLNYLKFLLYSKEYGKQGTT